jgi:hypothetical protein
MEKLLLETKGMGLVYFKYSKALPIHHALSFGGPFLYNKIIRICIAGKITLPGEAEPLIQQAPG